jgi:hypothetical protein
LLLTALIACRSILEAPTETTQLWRLPILGSPMMVAEDGGVEQPVDNCLLE